MAIRGIIFDHDGTLVDSERVHMNVWQALLRQWDISLSEQTYWEHYLGVPTLRCAEDIQQRFQLPLDAQDLCRQKHAMTQKVMSEAPAELLPGIEPMLKHCKDAGLRVAIASGASRAEIFSSITNHACLNHFNIVSCREDVPRNKPAPDVYLLALSKLGLNSHECVAIEDSQSGVSSAVSAGLYCIAIPQKYSAHQDFSQANFIAETPVHAWQHIVQI